MSECALCDIIKMKNVIGMLLWYY